MESEPFEFIPHTADVAVLIRGRDVAGLLRNAAAALYHLVGLNAVDAPKHVLQVRIDSVDSDTLLVDWLNELIYLLYARHLAFSEFRFDELVDGRLVAECCGSLLPASALRLSREVKAATYHMVHIAGNEEGCVASIVFDV